MPDPNDLLTDLDARGLIHDSTDKEALADRLNQGPVTVYCGFDPTADSLHVGHLLGLLGLRRFREAGHRVLALTGGATGMVGDPSGRSDERNLLDAETLAHNLAAIGSQISRILGDDTGWELVDNATWTEPVGVLQFLRDVGKYVTVNQMVAKESVRTRMEGESGISFTEFSYMLLQAHDYWWLHTNRSCELQIGGSDQWGNITTGIELVRKKAGASVHGLTWPLLLKSDGTKFGKSAVGENVWLDSERTSPYRFYQSWVQAEDADVERLLMQLTLMDVHDIRAVVDAHAETPHARAAQKRLAAELTELVHGPEALAAALEASELIFGSSSIHASEAALDLLVGEVPTLHLEASELAEGIPILDLLVKSGLAKSGKEARRVVDQGGSYCNDQRASAETALTAQELLHGRFAFLRKGRRTHALVVVSANR